MEFCSWRGLLETKTWRDLSSSSHDFWHTLPSMNVCMATYRLVSYHSFGSSLFAWRQANCQHGKPCACLVCFVFLFVDFNILQQLKRTRKILNVKDDVFCNHFHHPFNVLTPLEKPRVPTCSNYSWSHEILNPIKTLMFRKSQVKRRETSEQDSVNMSSKSRAKNEQLKTIISNIGHKVVLIESNQTSEEVPLLTSSMYRGWRQKQLVFLHLHSRNKGSTCSE